MLLHLLLACPRGVTPTAPVAPPVAAVPTQPTDPAGISAWMIRGDPLARRPRLPTGSVDPGTDAFVAVASGTDPRPAEWWTLDRQYAGTVAVPLAAGARLAAVETTLAAPEDALDFVIPLARGRTTDLKRPAIAAIGAAAESLLPMMERQVLLAWMDGPDVPASAAAALLSRPEWARLAESPAGRLLAAQEAHADATVARAALVDATFLALMEATANTDREQDALRALLGEHGRAGIDERLREAEAGLRADASDPEDRGGALLAQAALRWRGACADPPCGGLDRVRAIVAAGRWGPGTAALSASWRAIVWKNADDHLVAAWDHASFSGAASQLVEALLVDDATLDRSLLRMPTPDARFNLAVSRALGGGDLTSKEDLFRTIERKVAVEADAALKTAPERLREPLSRMAKRARQSSG